MNAERLLALYERIADAPDAVPRLRRFILDLAVRGKLHHGGGSPPKLTKLGEVAKLQNGFAFKSEWFSASGTRLLRNANVGHGVLNWEDEVRLPEPMVSEYERFLLNKGDVVLSLDRPFIVTGTKVARVTANDLPSLLLQRVGRFIVSSGLSADYLYLWITSPHFSEQIDPGRSNGVPHVSSKQVEAAGLFLPSIIEQHRIVAKVDELMALCDQLEKAREQREATRDRFAAATFARLNAPDPETFRNDAQFALGALTALTTRPDQIKQLRQIILNLAVRGKLVPQDPNGEAASELLKRIACNRKQLYAEKKIPKPKALPSIEEVGVPFALPSGWAWSMLGDLCYQVSDGPHFSPQYVAPDDGIPFLSTRNVRVGGFDLSALKYVSRDDHEEFCKRVRPEKDDIIYTKGGTTGIAKVNDLGFEFSVWVHLAVLRIEKLMLAPRYVEMALNSPHCYEQSQQYTQGTSNFDLGLTRMIKITIPIPPLAEQRRIVAKVDQLMKVCDDLEGSLAKGDDIRRRLLDALLVEALAPVKDREMQAAE